MNRVNPLSLHLLQHPPEASWIVGPGGCRIPVRRYAVEGTRRPVVLLHGLQSHSGWFVQSASRLAELGYPVMAFDRCGSGLSEAACDGGTALSGLLVEIDTVVAETLKGRVHDSVTILGHCFGSLPGLLYAALHRPERVANLILATPALFTRRSIPPRDTIRVLWSVLARRPVQIAVPLSPEDFSEEDRFIAFAREDPLALKEVPGRFLYEIRRARGRLPQAVESLRAPLMVAMAGDDPIGDNDRNRKLLERASVPAEFQIYPSARHVLEFSGERERFLDDLAGWLARREEG